MVCHWGRGGGRFLKCTPTGLTGTVGSGENSAPPRLPVFCGRKVLCPLRCTPFGFFRVLFSWGGRGSRRSCLLHRAAPHTDPAAAGGRVFFAPSLTCRPPRRLQWQPRAQQAAERLASLPSASAQSRLQSGRRSGRQERSAPAGETGLVPVPQVSGWMPSGAERSLGRPLCRRGARREPRPPALLRA